ncbi:MAG TPA: hypothetical protein PLZ75_08820 [Bacteroidales bacterium]|jgi:hypothetical protein|nr:hypothetical protein [Bacteroidales bacterium]HQH25321.1 hypothetical protein [Bacteroidales bacterium]HQJ82457.1 hypothetical protein [Bacteroidales bacterium]
MKKINYSAILAVAFLLLASPLFSQQSSDERDFKFTIKTNPLSALGGPFWIVVVPVTGEYKALFEAAVSKKSSVQIGLGYIGPSILLNLDDLTSDGEGSEIEGIKTSGFRSQGWYKYFLSRDLSAPEGFYIGPHISYASANIKNKRNTSEYVSATKLNINGVFGYQLITSGGFTLDIFTGLGFVSRKWEVKGTDWDNDSFKDKASVAVPFGFSFGYAF